MGYIYKITNKINQKSYIGLTTKTIQERWQEHIQVIDKYKNVRPLYSALAKYGLEAFSIEEIEEVDDDYLGEREIYWISYFNTYQKGYNATLGGDGKWTHSIEQYNLNGDLIAVYNNITEAIKSTNISESVIRAVCRHVYKTAKGYIFKYSDDNVDINELIAKAKTNNYYKVPVYQYNLDGSLLAIWSSIQEAIQNTKVSNIKIALNKSKPCCGYVWRTEDKDFWDNLDLTSIIVQLSLDNEIICYYDSFLSAAKALNKKQGSAISECCRNISYHKTAYGYKWRFLKDVL